MRQLGSVSSGTIAAGTLLDVLNPATGECWAQVAEASAADVDQVVGWAREAFDSTWRHVDPSERGRLLYRWADVIEAHAEELAQLDSTDTGNLLAEARGDARSAVNWLRYYAGMADKIEGRSLPDAPGRMGYTVRQPFGVVAGINAYNANTTQFAWKAGPALAAGNVFILKAPEVSPASSLRMGELALEAGFPAGVVNVITGRGEITGSALAAHPGIGRLVFTGSAGTAERIAAAAAPSLKPLGFELGGKNAVIVLPDFNERMFVPSLLHSNFVKSGQSCASGSRVFLPAAQHDELVERLGIAVRAVRVGDPAAPESQMGSLISTHHRDRIDAVVQAGVKAGATVVAGGAVGSGALAAGAFYQPTLVAGLADDNPIARTELFGPVISALRYDDLDEAIDRANALDSGLTAQIWGDSASAIQYAIKRLEVGTVWVNTYRSVHWTAPYGGFKRSGYGRENGFEAIDLYTQTKTVMWDLTGDERALPYQA
jgi:acyl-CoA reductase-like NAD-dependent aldehyde dehydrogenase